MPDTPPVPMPTAVSSTTDTEPTKYVILRQPPGEQDTWHIERPSVPANSAEAAIRKALATAAPDDKFVAIPLRSFRPVTVQAVQTTVLKLENADG